MIAVEADNFAELKRELEDHLLKYIVPGMIHNFANPLNGVMGRASLLQRRLEECGARGNMAGESLTDSEEMFNKITRDVDLISQGGNQLFELFNVVTSKFTRLMDTEEQRIDLSELLKAELAFFDFYLDYKHTIKKKALLDHYTPAVKGVPADFSISFSTIINHSITSMKDSPSKVLVLSTGFDAEYVNIRIDDTGGPIEGRERDMLMGISAGEKGEPFLHSDMYTLFHAACLMKRYGAGIDISREAEINSVVIRLPY